MMIEANVELPNQGDNIIRTKDLDVTPNPKGLGWEVFDNLRKYKKEIAQLNTETDETDTYEELLKRCVRVALHLQKRGVTPKDFVSPCTYAHNNSTEVVLAPILLGATLACIDPFSSVGDTRAMIDLVKPKVLFVCKESEEKIENILKDLGIGTELVVFGDTKSNTPYTEFLKPFSKEEEENFIPFEVKDLFQTAVVAFTSGSTSLAKGICINHYSIICQILRFRTPDRNHNVKNLMFSSLAWISAIFVLLSHVFMGSCNMLCRDFTPEKVWKYLRKYDIDALGLSTYGSMSLLKYGNPDKLKTPNLKVIFVAGGKISAQSLQDMSTKLFLNPVFVAIAYGQSEVFGAATAACPPQVQMKKPSACGVPISGFWYKIVDVDTGKALGPNQEGEICLKSKFVMNGYYNRDFSERFDENGFLKTGDIGYYDEDHVFHFVERYSDTFKYKSRWIEPTYLENILYEHPAVKIACVIGYISKDDYMVASGVVVKTDSAQNVTESELVEYVHGKVDETKRLEGGIVFVEESFVPFTPSGKIKRYRLKKNLLERLGKPDIS